MRTFLKLFSTHSLTIKDDLTVSDSESINYPNLDFKTPELAPLKVKLIPAELQERIKGLFH